MPVMRMAIATEIFLGKQPRTQQVMNLNHRVALASAPICTTFNNGMDIESLGLLVL